jgi:hypothetical protein
MHIPSLESVYQAMVMQNNILNKQRAIMADIARRAQEQGRSTQIPLISNAVLARVREKEDAQLNKGYVVYLIVSQSLMNVTSVCMKGESINCQIAAHSQDFLWPVLGFRLH